MRPALQTHARDDRRHDRVGRAPLPRVSSGRARSGSGSRTRCAPTSASSRAATASPAGSRPRRSTSPLDGEHELHLYRIVQETLANVARHARARQVTVRLARRGPASCSPIHDDGVGFVPAAAEPRGLGLVTMRERAEIMGATLTIRSRPRRGTEVRVVLPLASPRAAV